MGAEVISGEVVSGVWIEADSEEGIVVGSEVATEVGSGEGEEGKSFIPWMHIWFIGDCSGFLPLEEVLQTLTLVLQIIRK